MNERQQLRSRAEASKNVTGVGKFLELFISTHCHVFTLVLYQGRASGSTREEVSAHSRLPTLEGQAARLRGAREAVGLGREWAPLQRPRSTGFDRLLGRRSVNCWPHAHEPL